MNNQPYDSEGYMILRKKDTEMSRSERELRKEIKDCEVIITEQENVIEILRETTGVAEAIIGYLIRAILKPRTVEGERDDFNEDEGLALDLIAGQKPTIYNLDDPTTPLDIFKQLKTIDGVTISYTPGHGIRITPHHDGE